MTIILNDNLMEFIDETSCDIVIDKNLVPEDIKVDDELIVHYEEDVDTVSHKYVVKSLDNNKVVLSFVEMLDNEPDLLLEKNIFKRDPIKQAVRSMDRAIAKSAKLDKKYKQDLEKSKQELIKRDLKSPEGSTWAFYLQEKEDKWTGPHKREAIKDAYKLDDNGQLSPAVANAIVLSRDGYYVRRGLEDLYRKGAKAPTDPKELFKPLDPKFAMSWATEEVAMPNPEDAIEEPAAQDTTANNQEVTTNNTTTDTAANNETAPENTQNAEQTPKSSRFYASKNLIDNFKKLAQATGLQIIGADGKPLDVKTLNTRNLGNVTLKINNKSINLTSWLKNAVQTKILGEDFIAEKFPVTLDDIDLDDPKMLNIKDKMRNLAKREEEKELEAARSKKQEELKAKYEHALDALAKSRNMNETIEEQLEALHTVLVPTQGPSETVGGELVRAMMRLLYRDYNDGDKFFEGYGLETCASSAEFLYDNGYDEFITTMLDEAFILSDNDQKYTDMLLKLAEALIDDINANPELLWTENTLDSREYDYSMIEENQPRYELSFLPSDDIVLLLEESIITAWDVNTYVESQLEWETELRDAVVGTPWSTYSTEVTVENLTKDGYDRLADMTRHDSFWEDLEQEYVDDLETIKYSDEDESEDSEEYEEVDDDFDDEI